MVTFARVVKTGSFSLAARDLDLSKSAVSKRVAALEERLGLRLIHRSTRKLATTEAGEAFYERCTRVLEEAEGALDAAAAHHEEPHGLLRVNGPVFFGELFLVPLVPRLLERHPRLQIELTLSDEFIDPIESRMDVTVRVARLADSSMVARKLCEDRRYVVGSPAYLARAGVPETPDDLTAHDCLRFLRLTQRDEWRFLRRPVGPDVVATRREDEYSVPTKGRLATDSGSALVSSAVAGLGLTLLPGFMVRAEVNAGRLVPVLDGYMPRGHGVYALHGHHRHVPPKVRALLEALQDAVRA